MRDGKRRGTVLLLGIAIMGLSLPRTYGEETFVSRDKVTNAALIYWQAFSMMPQLSPEETEQLRTIESAKEWRTEFASQVPDAGVPFELINSIRPETPCRWEIIEQGAGTLLPHLGKARQLARLLTLRARVEAAAGNQQAAVERLAEAMLLARNVDEGVLINLLVGIAIESQVIETASLLLDSLDPNAVERLNAAMAVLPPGATLTDAMRYEKSVFLAGLEKTLQADDETALAELRLLGPQLPTAGVPAWISDFLAEPRDARMARLKELADSYDQAIAATEREGAAATKTLTELEASYQQSGNPLIQQLMPSASKALERYSTAQEKWKTFRAQLAKRSGD